MAKFKIGDFVEITESGYNNTSHRWYTRCLEKGEVHQIEDIDPALNYGGSYTLKIRNSAYGAKAVKLVDKPAELTSLPEKWYIKTTNLEEGRVIGKWFDENDQGVIKKSDNKPKFYENASASMGGGISNAGFGFGVCPDHTQITFDQFKKFVLKQNDTPAQPKFKFEIGKTYTEFDNKNLLWRIFRPINSTDCHYINTDVDAYFPSHRVQEFTDSSFLIKLSEPSEVLHMDACIKAGQFVPKPSILSADNFKAGVNDITPAQQNNLLEEAKRRYPVGTKFRVVHQPERTATVRSHETYENTFLENGTRINLLVSDSSDSDGPTVYYKNKWAEIVENVDSNAVPEYVEMVRTYGKGTAQTVGKIYETDGISKWKDDDGEWRPTLKDCIEDGELKPSTKAAYEAQKQKKYEEAYGDSAKPESLVGRWVKIVSDETTDRLPIGGYHQITHDEYFKTEKTVFVDNRPHCLIESEFELMPEGFHPDNIKTISSSNPIKEGWNSELGIYIHKGSTPGPSFIDIETAPLKNSWDDKWYNYLTAVPVYFKKSSENVKPSSKVSVKSHEEFKIKINKPKTIKL